MENIESSERKFRHDYQLQRRWNFGNQRRQNEYLEDNNAELFIWAFFDTFKVISFDQTRYTCDEWKNKNLKFSDLEKASNSDNKLKYGQIHERFIELKIGSLIRSRFNINRNDMRHENRPGIQFENCNDNNRNECKKVWLIKYRFK